jgi:hypothetical protein
MAKNNEEVNTNMYEKWILVLCEKPIKTYNIFHSNLKSIITNNHFKIEKKTVVHTLPDSWVATQICLLYVFYQ